MKKKNYNKINKSQAISTKISLQLISLCESSHDPWGIKDLESYYLYCNKAYLSLLNLPSNFDIEGKIDDEIPHPISEFAYDFQEQERKTVRSKKPVAALEIHPYGYQKIIQPYIFDKLPLYDEVGKCLGTVFHAKKIQIFSLMHFLNGKLSCSLTVNPPVEFFTNKELEVIFFVLQSLSSKEIAKRLNLSYRTIENKLQEIYSKAGVNSCRMLKEFCLAKGFDKYFPPKFLHPCSQIISDIDNIKLLL